MTGFTNPSISGEAARRALGGPEASATSQRDADAGRAELDAQELRELEQSLYGHGTALDADPPPAVVDARPSWRQRIARILRRA